MDGCISCGAITSSPVCGRIGTTHGVLCTDCQHWCDGNVCDPQCALPVEGERP